MLLRLTIHSHTSPPPSPPTLLTPSVSTTPRVENIITSSHYLVTFKISASLDGVSPRTPCMCTLTHSTQPANISKKVTWTGTGKHIQTCQLACVHMASKGPTALCRTAVCMCSSIMENLCWADKYHRIIHNLFVGHFSIAGQSSSAVSVLSCPCSWWMPIYLRC